MFIKHVINLMANLDSTGHAGHGSLYQHLSFLNLRLSSLAILTLGSVVLTQLLNNEIGQTTTYMTVINAVAIVNSLQSWPEPVIAEDGSEYVTMNKL